MKVAYIVAFRGAILQIKLPFHIKGESDLYMGLKQRKMGL